MHIKSNSDSFFLKKDNLEDSDHKVVEFEILKEVWERLKKYRLQTYNFRKFITLIEKN